MTKYEYTKKVMERVDTVLLQHKITSKELSTRTGIHVTMLSRYRTGQRVLGAYPLQCIADALDLSVNALTGENED